MNQPVASPPCFGFIVSNYLYHEYASYNEARADRARLSAKAKRPKNFSIMKQLNADGCVCYFITNHKYKQARTLTEAIIWYGHARAKRETSAAKRGKRTELRIRTIINASGPPEDDVVAAARQFYRTEIASCMDAFEQQSEGQS